ncbi:NAD(P)-dependent alcohol dehydrogenase [Desulfosporosinus fructosivorans]
MLSKAAVIYNPGEKYVIENIEVASPKANEVMVKIVGCGLCHTDELAQTGIIPITMPVVLGHEGAGVVVEIGPGVEGINVGDHVVLSYSSCGHCEMCLTGNANICVNNMKLNFGGAMSDGTSRLSLNGKDVSNFFGHSSFGNYAVANQRNVVVVDKDVDLTILGPLGCGIQTGAGTVLNGLRCKFGTSIVVFGAGAVGCAAIMAAKIANCQNIIAIDIVPEKLQLAKELGATHVINGKEVEDVVKEIQEITKGGAHYSVETTGVPALVNQSLYSLRTGGHCAVVGVSGDVTINVFGAIMLEGRTMQGFIQGNAIPQLFIPKLVEYFKAGLFPLDKLIKVYDLEQINEAYDDVHKGKALKAVVKM